MNRHSKKRFRNSAYKRALQPHNQEGAKLCEGGHFVTMLFVSQRSISCTVLALLIAIDRDRDKELRLNLVCTCIMYQGCIGQNKKRKRNKM